MDVSDLHEASFVWPHTDATVVIVTGSFDQWASSIHLAKYTYGFEAKVRVPWGEKIPYKFIVDGRWVTRDDQPTEPDEPGNINNIYLAPSKPEPVVAASDPPAVVPNSSECANSAPSSPGTPCAGAYDLISEGNATVAQTRALSDTADSLLGTVRDSTSAALEYIASGLGIGSTTSVPTESTNETLKEIAADASNELPSCEGTPLSRDVRDSHTEVVPVIPIPILPINDDTTTHEPMNEPAPTNEDSEAPSTHVPGRRISLNVLALAPMVCEAPSEEPAASVPAVLGPTNPSATEVSTHGPVVLPSPTPHEEAVRDVFSKSPVTGATSSTVAAPAPGAETPSSSPIHAPGLTDLDKIDAANNIDAPLIPPKDTPRENTTAPASVTETTTTSDSPKTPVKGLSFPSNLATPDTSPSSKFSTASSRKKRKSFLGKVKGLFHHKEKSK
ncbi:hypothetical protein BJ138DRAFT_1121615 [Hygrophoropsis aurantiaca]|uniref:Uncharacterized protein n=1 Tax=Hygrophoropsis aurantiaca TaxID=72124 RepID=A0ACB8ATS5_9AGAM|nr:hypothetical protein BJ138DRAFT_1121615 [Hygrophoropsis aurantiaca]